jgi:hypothetical protein
MTGPMTVTAHPAARRGSPEDTRPGGRAAWLGLAVGFFGVLTVIWIDAMPFLSAPAWSPGGYAALAAVGASAGLLAPALGGWAGLITGAITAIVLNLTGTLFLAAWDGPSLIPADEWRMLLFSSAVASLGVLSGGWLVTAWLRSGRPTAIGSLARGTVLGVAGGALLAILVVGGVAVAFSASRMVIPASAPVIRIVLTADGLEVPARIEPGTYVVIVTSRLAEPRGLTLVARNRETLQPLSDAEIELFLSGTWQGRDELEPPVFQFHGVGSEPGEHYGGPITLEPANFLGDRYAWYSWVPDEQPPGVDDVHGEELPASWPPEHVAYTVVTRTP